ncbi:MAG: hypothetical protein GY820_39150 [Gammaproteobacteria bacterium]|nr:hypothetical protein [Gammaproteobacteria bacterium]
MQGGEVEQMIHYHGADGIQAKHIASVLPGKHAFISFSSTRRVGDVAELCQSFAFDNGAFSTWKSGKRYDVYKYIKWVKEWMYHPGFDWHLIPDKIDGSEDDNLKEIQSWPLPRHLSVPVFHMHESNQFLIYISKVFPRIAIGSSAEFATVGTEKWWHRMNEIMNCICDEDGRPVVKVHGLRMLNPAVFTKLPLSSADSTNVSRSYHKDKSWYGPFQPANQQARGQVLVGRIEAHNSAPVWTQPLQKKLW